MHSFILIVVFGILFFLLLLSPVSDLKTDLAVKAASYLDDLETAEIRILDDYERIKKFLVTVNQIIDKINDIFKNTGVNIEKFELDEENTIKIASTIKYFEDHAPLLETYNVLIECSKEVDRNDPESINKFYWNILLFVSDIAFIQEKIIYRVVYKAVGKANTRLGLARLRSICGDACYRFSLKKMYWAGREFSEDMQNKLNEFLRYSQTFCVNSLEGKRWGRNIADSTFPIGLFLQCNSIFKQMKAKRL